VLSVELECFFRSVVEAILVSQEVSEWSDLTNNWTVLDNLSHDVLGLVRDAVILDPVELAFDSAHVGL
jgi:hypothetical protein